MFKHILIPTDGSEISTGAIEPTLSLAREIGAQVTLLTVIEPFHTFSTNIEQLESSRSDYARQAAEDAEAILAAAEAKARAYGLEPRKLQVQSDRPYEGILDTAARERCDLIAMASHGRGGLAAVVLGSQTQKVLTHSKIPVLVYR